MMNTAELLERIKSWDEAVEMDEASLSALLWALAMDRDLLRAFEARVHVVRDDYHNEIDRNYEA